MCMCIPKKDSETFQSFKKKLVLVALQDSEEALSRLAQRQEAASSNIKQDIY